MKNYRAETPQNLLLIPATMHISCRINEFKYIVDSNNMMEREQENTPVGCVPSLCADRDSFNGHQLSLLRDKVDERSFTVRSNE